MAIPVLLLNVLEALQVQAEHMRKRLDLHPLLGVLQPLACVAEELVGPIQSLCRAAQSQAPSSQHTPQIMSRSCTGTPCVVDYSQMRPVQAPLR